MNKKSWAIVISVVLICCAVVAGTIAYVTKVNDEVKNVFIIGDVDVTFEEQGEGTPDANSSNVNNFNAMPGNTVYKDPIVTVKANSKACWLFVQVNDQSDGNLTAVVDSTEGWAKLSGTKNVYYQAVSQSTSDQAFHVLTVPTGAEKRGVVISSDVDGDTEDFSLSIHSGAVQKDNVASAAAAWDEIKSNFTDYEAD